jgi:hypothetical protein
MNLKDKQYNISSVLHKNSIDVCFNKLDQEIYI